VAIVARLRKQVCIISHNIRRDGESPSPPRWVCLPAALQFPAIPDYHFRPLLGPIEYGVSSNSTAGEPIMKAQPLEALLEKLCSGDTVAAECAFQAYEPYLRKVVRRHLPPHVRAKFDSSDIVQSVWVSVLSGFRNAGWRFVDTSHLRAFLVEATRNRFIDRVRQHQTALDHERPLGLTDPADLPSSKEPRPSEIAQANDLWEKMLGLCSPGHQEILRLKRNGLTLTEIASRTGMHEGSVRRVLRELARRLALRQKPIPIPSPKSSES
jgi:RNA polymerase sigma factor (sigma-70 family)